MENKAQTEKNICIYLKETWKSAAFQALLLDQRPVINGFAQEETWAIENHGQQESSVHGGWGGSPALAIPTGCAKTKSLPSTLGVSDWEGVWIHISRKLLDHHTLRNPNFEQSRNSMPDASSPNKGTLPRYYTLVSKKSVFMYYESLLFLGDLSQFSLINLKRESFSFLLAWNFCICSSELLLKEATPHTGFLSWQDSPRPLPSESAFITTKVFEHSTRTRSLI